MAKSFLSFPSVLSALTVSDSECRTVSHCTICTHSTLRSDLRYSRYRPGTWRGAEDRTEEERRNTIRHTVIHKRKKASERTPHTAHRAVSAYDVLYHCRLLVEKCSLYSFQRTTTQCSVHASSSVFTYDVVHHCRAHFEEEEEDEDDRLLQLHPDPLMPCRLHSAARPPPACSSSSPYLRGAHPPLDLGSLRAAEALLTCDGATTSGRTKLRPPSKPERAFSRLRDEGWFRETGKLAFTHDVEQEEDGARTPSRRYDMLRGEGSCTTTAVHFVIVVYKCM